MELDQDPSSVRKESTLSAPHHPIRVSEDVASASPSFYPSSFTHPPPGTSNLDLLARSVQPVSSNRTELPIEGLQSKNHQLAYTQFDPSTSNDLRLVASSSLSSSSIPLPHDSLYSNRVDSYDPPSRSTVDDHQQHDMDTSPSSQQQTYQNIHYSSSLISSSSTLSTGFVGSDLQPKGHSHAYASQSVKSAAWRNEAFPSTERVNSLETRQPGRSTDTVEEASLAKMETDTNSKQTGVEAREDDDEELEPADSDVDMDSMENGQESEKKKKKWNKAPQSGKNWRSGLKRAPDGSWEVPPDSASKKANQASHSLQPPDSVLSTPGDAVLTAEPSSISTSTSNPKKPKPKAKPKSAQAAGPSTEPESSSSLKKKVVRKKKQPAGTTSQGPTRSPSPTIGLPIDQSMPTASSSRARSYSQSVDPEGAMEEEGSVEVTGRKSAKRRKIEEKEREREREKEMEELLRRQREEEDEESEDDQLYCVCNSRYDADSPMIACDMCAEWYHPKCVEIPEEEIELVDLFVCPRCHEETAEKTTWRTKCRSADCFKPAVPPLTKYCSTTCGTAHLTALLENKDIDLARHWDQVERAQRPSGVVILNPDFPTQQSSASTSVTSINPPQSPASVNLGSSESTSQDLSNHPATRHLYLTDTNLRTSIDKVQNQLSLLSNRLTLLSFASNRADTMPSVASLSLRDDPAVSPERPAPGSKRGSQKKKSSAGGNAGGSAQGDRPCGFDRRLILDEQDFGKFVQSEEGRALFTPPSEDDVSGDRVKREGSMKAENEQAGDVGPVDPGFETYLRAGEKDLERKQKAMSEADPQADMSAGSGGHQDGNVEMEDIWCYRSKKKCEGHRGWQKIRLIDFQLEQSSKRNTLGLLDRTRSILQQDMLIAQKRIRGAMAKPEVKLETKGEAEVKVETETETGAGTGTETGTAPTVPDQSISNGVEKSEPVTVPVAPAAASATIPTPTGTDPMVTEVAEGIDVSAGIDTNSNPSADVDLPMAN